MSPSAKTPFMTILTSFKSHFHDTRHSENFHGTGTTEYNIPNNLNEKAVPWQFHKIIFEIF